MPRFSDYGFSSLSYLKPELWVQCPKCSGLAKITETREQDQHQVNFCCTQCSYRPQLDYARSYSYSWVTYYHNLNHNIEHWRGACEISLNQKCLSCKQGRYKFTQHYARTSQIPQQIKVECSFCLKTQIFDPSQFNINKQMNNKIGHDPYFHCRLFLITPVRQGEICAFNPEHLQQLKAYISADLREKATFSYNRSYFSRLPAWIKSARNRKEILKAILRLEAMISTMSA